MNIHLSFMFNEYKQFFLLIDLGIFNYFFMCIVNVKFIYVVK